MQSGKYIEFKGHQGSITDIEFSPDGKSITTASRLNTAWIYYLESSAILEMVDYQCIPGIPTSFIEKYGIAEILIETGKWDNFLNNNEEPNVLYHFGKYYEDKTNSTSNPDTRQAYRQKAKACYTKAYQLSEYDLYRRLGEGLK